MEYKITAFIQARVRAYQQNCRITPFDMTVFFRQFAVLVSAGVPIVKSLDILEKSQEKIAMRHLLFAVKKDLRAGKNFFHSLRNHPLYFDLLTCQLIHIGEQTGKLDAMLKTIASLRENNLALQRRIRQALFYPCFLFISALAVTLCMLIFVIPHFAELFQDAHVPLPLLTRVLFHVSAFIQHYILWLLLLCAVVMLTPLKQTDRLTLLCTHLPLVRHHTRKIILTRFMRNLAVTYHAGIAVTDAIKLSASTHANSEFMLVTTSLREKISSGFQLHQAMAALSFFPVLMVQMIKIGEESGRLAQVLDKTADFFEADIDQLLNRATQLLEPLIILVLGGVIGVIMAGMYLPIFKLGNAL
jgi:type IV pilus assembly protein PilC